MASESSPSDCISTYITTNFLETLVGCPVASFSIESGSNLGDNYMSVLYSISCEVISNPKSESQEKEIRHFMLKCFPTHPSRQKFLKKANLFFKEVSFYRDFSDDLMNFQKEHVNLSPRELTRLAVPTFIGGSAINFLECAPEIRENVCSPLDNFILMSDLRKDGYKMTDRTKGLDADHMKLAFGELAVMHALSWAFRKTVHWELTTKYPFMTKKVHPDNIKMWAEISKKNVKTAEEAIDSILGNKNILSESLNKFTDKAKIIIQYFNSQDEASESLLSTLHRMLPTDFTSHQIKSWRVVCHGDCWNNNQLFKYNEETKKPEKVKLIDFPLVRLGCPTLDLSCLVYTSTRRDFRSPYLDQCLHLYHDKFNEVCQAMKVETLPDFSVQNLQRKFHLTKVVGFLIALMSLPLNLIDKGKEMDLDKMEDNSTLGDMLQKVGQVGADNSLYAEWILELVQEIYDEGVI